MLSSSVSSITGSISPGEQTILFSVEFIVVFMNWTVKGTWAFEGISRSVLSLKTLEGLVVLTGEALTWEGVELITLFIFLRGELLPGVFDPLWVLAMFLADLKSVRPPREFREATWRLTLVFFLPRVLGYRGIEQFSSGIVSIDLLNSSASKGCSIEAVTSL